VLARNCVPLHGTVVVVGRWWQPYPSFVVHHMLGNNVQTHECMDLKRAKLITDLISFIGFIMINKKLTAD
jgi:hypothetical protein